jgi:hypothetical protein
LIALQRKGPGKGAAAPAFIGIHRHRHPTSKLLQPRITVFITDDNDAA